jgi:MFS family permease
MYDPPYEHAEEAQFTFWQFVRRAPESNFVKFSIFVSLFYFGAYVSAPFFVPYSMNTLHFQQWQWVVMDSGQTLAAVLSFLFWGRFSTRFGNKKTLALTSVSISTIPMLWLCSDNFPFLTVVQAVAGAVWSGFNLAVTNYIMEAVTPAKRARCWAYCNIFIGVGMFGGSMAGTALGEYLPRSIPIAGIEVKSTFLYLLFISAVIRLTAGVFFLPVVRELRDVQPFSLSEWAFEIAGTRPQEGTRFGPVAEKPQPADPPTSTVEPKEAPPKDVIHK